MTRQLGTHASLLEKPSIPEAAYSMLLSFDLIPPPGGIVLVP